MKLSDFDYNLPSNLIAQEPMKPRDKSRLLVLDKESGEMEHSIFKDIDTYLQEGDVVVMNDSKVIPARLIGHKKDTQGKVEVFLHTHLQGQEWECLVGGRNIQSGLTVKFDRGVEGYVKEKYDEETWRVEFNRKESELMPELYRIGYTPLPPYIKREEGETKEDRHRYQTVYADDKKKGSVAAPTAGLHFTNRVMKKLKNKGVRFEYLTLHVGLGTFAPVKTEKIEEHKMHAEWAEVTSGTLKSIIKAKQEGRRVVAVGTTSVRVLEAVFRYKEYSKCLDKKFEIRNSKFENFKGWVDIFIYPGFNFQVVDAMLTNFHLPKSSLLMLVSAFACAEPSRSAGTSTELSTGKDNIDKAYREAVKEKYRFYSYGDSMLIK